MKEHLILLLYRLLLPVLFCLAFPGWVVKMLKRGGFGTKLAERIGVYDQPKDFEPCGATHVHAISVGETFVAIKLIKAWQKMEPAASFVLAVGTSTAHAAATKANLPQVRVTYIPLDFPWMIRSYLNRFEPTQVILVEGEIWPQFLRIAEKRGIPVSLANARMSPRSARRFRKFAPLLKPFFRRLSHICVQEPSHVELWETLGLEEHRIHFTGNIKFDMQQASAAPVLDEFEEILNAFGPGRPIVLAASTFPGEELLLTHAISQAEPNALPVIVPRHAERGPAVAEALRRAGFLPVLRTEFIHSRPYPETNSVLIINTTGELATWTSHADVVIIGKSFLAKGGQTPSEAIIARKPLILGPNMQNFQPLAADLLERKGALLVGTPEEIPETIRLALNPAIADKLTQAAVSVLATHNGATSHHLKVLHESPERA